MISGDYHDIGRLLHLTIIVISKNWTISIIVKKISWLIGKTAHPYDGTIFYAATQPFPQLQNKAVAMHFAKQLF